MTIFTFRSPRAMLCTSLTVLLAACGGGSDADTTQSKTKTLAGATQISAGSWTQCAVEEGNCSFSGTAQVRYGLNGTYAAAKTATGSIACNNQVFGDPAPGADKVCEYSSGTATPAPAPTAATWTQCAVEWGNCSVPTTSQVRYGLNGTYVTKTATGSIACNNDVFGDPLPGGDKVCEYSSKATTSPTTTQATNTTPTTSSTTPFGQDAAAYKLAFSEEFENGLNTSIWNDSEWYLTPNDTKNYTVENGALKIWPQRDASGNFFNRTFTTDGHYYQTYGYFEMEAKLPVGKGTWPAFWLYNHDGEERKEIDIMEAYAGGGVASGWSDANFHPTTYAPTIWTNTGVLGGTKMVQTPDLSAGFHKYGLKWEANKQTFYFDGVPVYSANVAMPNRMYILLDLFFGSASGTPDNSTPTGKANSYEVNYVRSWNFK